MTELIDGIPHIFKEELREILQGNDASLEVVDVREADEYAEAHIPGVKHVPMSEISDRFAEFDPGKKYVFVCRSGRRSLHVAKVFQENGFDVLNFKGGMLEWDGETVSGM
ncbi:MAG TPA: rhodanese-like domain-containing protein [Bacilli bacterium]